MIMWEQSAQQIDSHSLSNYEVICLEGNGARPSHNGDGYSTGGVMYTLNGVEVHCVAYERSENDEMYVRTSPE